MKLPMSSLKETTWFTILLFSLLYSFYVAFINLILFKSDVLTPIVEATNGLINETLIANLFSIFLFIFILILKLGKLHFSDLGLKKNRLLSAVAAIFTLWLLMQFINLIYGLIVEGRPVFYQGWNKYGSPTMFGALFGQFFGNSLFEELAFRGFLFVQIYKKFKNKKHALFIGITVSQGLFALIHIPNRILGGMSLVEIIPSLVIVFILGVLFTIIYLLTDNLFLAIGIHALWNMPFLVFIGIPSTLFMFISTILLLLFWEKSFGKLTSKTSKTVEEFQYRV